MRARLLHWEGMSMNDNWLFVGAAFGLTWIVLIGYFVHVRNALRAARALLDASTGSAR